MRDIITKGIEQALKLNDSSIKIEFVDKNDEMLKLIRPGMNVEADILIKSSTSAK